MASCRVSPVPGRILPADEFEEDGPVDSADGDEDEDEDIDGTTNGAKKWVFNAPSKPRKITEKRRADNAAFEAWIEKNQATLYRTSKKLVMGDKLSAAALV